MMDIYISVVYYCWSSLRHIAPYKKMQNGTNTYNKQSNKNVSFDNCCSQAKGGMRALAVKSCL